MFQEHCDSVLRIAAYEPNNFITENPQKLIKTMSTKDQEMFPFDVRKLNNEKYVEDFIMGIRKYLLKEDQSPEALMMARKKMDRF